MYKSYSLSFFQFLIILSLPICLFSQPDIKMHVEGSLQLDKIGPALGRLILNTVATEDQGRYGIQFSNNTLAPFVGDDIGNQHYDFYSYWSPTRNYDAIMRIHGKSTGTWGRYLEMTHDGTDGRISTDVGNLILNPSNGTGNIGIGLDNPTYPLHLKVSGYTGFLLNGDNSGDLQFRIQNLGGGNHFIFDDISENNALGIESSGEILINTNGVNERMRIDTNGYVGVNNDNPQVQFDVRGDHLRLSSLNDDKHIQFRTNGTALDLDANNAPLYIIAQNFITMGLANTNVGIGTENPSYKLQVGEMGDGTEARANAWNTLSDGRWKKNLVNIKNPLKKLQEVTGYYYYWKDGKDQSRQVGVIAQEVEEILPEVVSTDKEGFKSVDYGKLSALLIEAIKEQQILYNQLFQENTNLKTRINNVESQLRNHLSNQTYDR